MTVLAPLASLISRHDLGKLVPLLVIFAIVGAAWLVSSRPGFWRVVHRTRPVREAISTATFGVYPLLVFPIIVFNLSAVGSVSVEVSILDLFVTLGLGVHFATQAGKVELSRVFARVGPISYAAWGGLVALTLMSAISVMTVAAAHLHWFTFTRHGHRFVPSPVEAMTFYMWYLADAVPVAQLTSSFRLLRPFETHSSAVGVPILVFKTVVALPLIAVAASVWRGRHPRDSQIVFAEGRAPIGGQGPPEADREARIDAARLASLDITTDTPAVAVSRRIFDVDIDAVRRILVTAHPRELRMWDLETLGSEGQIRAGSLSHIHSVAASPAGGVAATTHRGRTRLWDLPNDALIGEFRQPGLVFSAAFDQDSRTLATASNAGWLVTWNTTESVMRVIVKDDDSSLTSAAFIAGEGPLLAVTTSAGYVRIFDSRSGEEFNRWRQTLARAQGLTGAATCSAAHPTEALLATGAGDGTVCVWRVRDGALVFRAHHEAVVWRIAWHADPPLVVTATEDALRLWSLTADRCLAAIGASLRDRFAVDDLTSRLFLYRSHPRRIYAVGIHEAIGDELR